MEDVLALYALPRDENRPLVCLDEFSKQLLSDVTDPIPLSVNHPIRQDSEYVREGSATAFMIALPHEGVRHVYFSPTGKRKAVDFAGSIDYLLNTLLPEAEKVQLVMDNLNTHKTASLYEAFPPEKARKLSERLEIHYTPKHGSWLNMAEIEIGKLVKSGLKERVPSLDAMKEQVNKYLERVNERPSPIEWQFTNKDARIKLKHLYPSI